MSWGLEKNNRVGCRKKRGGLGLFMLSVTATRKRSPSFGDLDLLAFQSGQLWFDLLLKAGGVLQKGTYANVKYIFLVSHFNNFLCTGSSQLMTICLATARSYDSAEKKGLMINP